MLSTLVLIERRQQHASKVSTRKIEENPLSAFLCDVVIRSSLCSKLLFLRLISETIFHSVWLSLEHQNNPKYVFFAHIVYSKESRGMRTLLSQSVKTLS